MLLPTIQIRVYRYESRAAAAFEPRVSVTSHVHYHGATTQATWLGADLTGAQFTLATAKRLDLTGANFFVADLTEASFENCTFDDADMSAVEFEGAILGPGVRARSRSRCIRPHTCHAGAMLRVLTCRCDLIARSPPAINPMRNITIGARAPRQLRSGTSRPRDIHALVDVPALDI